jgi:hypothetical protein
VEVNDDKRKNERGWNGILKEGRKEGRKEIKVRMST